MQSEVMGIARRGVSLGCLALSLVVVAPLVGCSSDRRDGDATAPELSPDGTATPGEAYLLRVGTHCGVERLGLRVNGVFWITDEAGATATDWVPAPWEQSIDGGLLPLTIVLSADRSELKAEASGHVVSYRPFADTDPEEFCE